MKNKRENIKFSRFFASNKKADVPVTILVIGVFALCTLAIFSFFVSSFKSQDSFKGVEVVEEANSLLEEYKFQEEAGVSDLEQELQPVTCPSPLTGKCILVKETFGEREIYVAYKIG